MAHALPDDSNVKSRVLLPPRRKVRLKVVFGSFLAAIAGPIALIAYSEAQFRYEVHLRHARTQRVLAEDYRMPAIPDDQNAAIPLSRAAASVNLTALQDWWLDHVYARPLIDIQRKYASEFISSHAQAIELVREARARPKVDWRRGIQSPVLLKNSPHIANEQIHLAKVLRLVAVYQHDCGDDRSCLESVRDLQTIARALDQEPYGFAHSVALGVEWMAADVAVRVAPSLRIAVKDDAPTAAGPAQIKAIISSFLDEPAHEASTADYWEFERMETCDMLLHSDFPEVQWVKNCYGRWESTAVMQIHDIAAAAAACTDWPTANKVLEESTHPYSWHEFAQSTTIYFPQKIKSQMRATVERRAAATALAMCLFRADHGNWPSQLPDLVPTYLHEVPKDAFAANGRPLSYVPADPPSLYSVGENGVDDHADTTGTTADGWYDPWKAPDVVIVLGATPLTTDWDPSNPPLPGMILKRTKSAQ